MPDVSTSIKNRRVKVVVVADEALAPAVVITSVANSKFSSVPVTLTDLAPVPAAVSLALPPALTLKVVADADCGVLYTPPIHTGAKVVPTASLRPNFLTDVILPARPLATSNHVQDGLTNFDPEFKLYD